ncbi:hypothetical protein BU17DRAFT_87196 [Hysterangium stoloniferum]|nr:hypothetical protein BU17DRAFT_87196 [Hysterangium stoloniferum]
MTLLRIGLAGAKSNVRVAQMLKGNVRRGGSGTAALTNSLDPTLYPTTPPQSSYKSGVPKIAGSKGGFIGLIVGLGVFIILFLFAAYYVLRIRPRRRSIDNRSGFFSSNPLTNRITKSRGGWVAQTDAFDYESDEDNKVTRNVEVGAAYAAGGKGYSGQSRSFGYSDLRQASTEEHDAYADPFDPEKLPESVHQQQAPLSITNKKSIGVNDDMNRKLSYEHSVADITPIHSPTSPSFEGGTRFKEQF